VQRRSDGYPSSKICQQRSRSVIFEAILKLLCVLNGNLRCWIFLKIRARAPTIDPNHSFRGWFRFTSPCS
jgi:hypothetical protein